MSPIRGKRQNDKKREKKASDVVMTLCFLGCFINPFAPGDFAEKRVLKLVEWFSGHCRAPSIKITALTFLLKKTKKDNEVFRVVYVRLENIREKTFS